MKLLGVLVIVLALPSCTDAVVRGLVQSADLSCRMLELQQRDDWLNPQPAKDWKVRL